VPELGERDLPAFLWEIVERWKQRCALGLLQEFTPNEATCRRTLTTGRSPGRSLSIFLYVARAS